MGAPSARSFHPCYKHCQGWRNCGDHRRALPGLRRQSGCPPKGANTVLPGKQTTKARCRAAWHCTAFVGSVVAGYLCAQLTCSLVYFVGSLVTGYYDFLCWHRWRRTPLHLTEWGIPRTTYFLFKVYHHVLITRSLGGGLVFSCTFGSFTSRWETYLPKRGALRSRPRQTG